MSGWTGKTVLITGACGTVGRELLRQVALQEPQEIIALDNNESDLFFLSQEYADQPEVRFYFADVRDRAALQSKMEGVQIAVHCAALKHVLLNEEAPRDAIKTNILGTQNLIDSALAKCVERVLFTSSDKAVNPTSVMGTSKLMGERLMTAADSLRRGSGPIFISTRFGNVLGSRGSVIPLFKRQIQTSRIVTLTDPRMTRFIMTLEEAVKLVTDSVFLGRGGEVFVTKMPVVRIQDLAEVMIEELSGLPANSQGGVQLQVVGAKPGEKLYEELMNEEEVRRTIELQSFYAVTPAFRSVYNSVEYQYPAVISMSVDKPYNSANEPVMDKESLRAYLYQHGLLKEQAVEDPPVAEFA